MITKQMIEEVFSNLKQSEVNTHLWHLQTSSYAEHKALNAYYDGLLDLTDELIECWQGKNKTKIQGPSSISMIPYNQKNNHFEKLCDFIEEMIEKSDDELDIQDHFLGIKNLINKTKYLFMLS